MKGPGDAIEKEQLLMREIPVGGDEPFDVMVPDPQGDIIGEEVALTGIGVVELSGRGFRGEASEDLSRGEMKMVPCAAEELAKGPLSRAWGAENEDRTVGSVGSRYK